MDDPSIRYGLLGIDTQKSAAVCRVKRVPGTSCAVQHSRKQYKPLGHGKRVR